jgi:mRNA-degrading endonuclease RelE of RelBE toxin-antitoxin system
MRQRQPGIAARHKAKAQWKGRENQESREQLTSQSGQAKELKDELVGLRSYRLGNARIIFRFTRQVVEVIAFGPQRDIYERVVAEFSTLLRRREERVNDT